ncbi:hypothetical protein [Prochlorococcus sp. MIT 1300]|uniref:hypothetical protein n=1 Tax=Prochlorococcus sp. MIT 1300 TaxID=3096218 RepID=UPI002A761613|nr:hypothetical protein [Prochlorococcus sp. MIT 1300]
MDGVLVKEIGTKALLAGVAVLVLYWTVNAARLVIGARGLNPLVKQFFTQIASGRIDAAYLLTTKTYRQHVNRQQFVNFLAGLKLSRYSNLKSGRPRLEEGQIILTLKLKSEDKKNELPLDFTFTKVDDVWKIDRITEVKA